MYKVGALDIAKLVYNQTGVYGGYICSSTRQDEPTYFSRGALFVLLNKIIQNKYSPLAKWMHGRLHNCGCPRLPQLPSRSTGGTAAAAIGTSGVTTGAASSGAGASAGAGGG